MKGEILEMQNEHVFATQKKIMLHTFGKKAETSRYAPRYQIA